MHIYTLCELINIYTHICIHVKKNSYKQQLFYCFSFMQICRTELEFRMIF